ncbi:MAG: DMT family transporter [Clostridiales bacterium]|nr:DMT family transporter [Clostridiales bacterium]
MNLSNKTKAVLYILASAFGFAMMNLFVRLAGDLPSMEKSFFRNLVAMLVAAFLLLREDDHPTFRTLLWGKGNLPDLLLRSAAGTVGILCNFYAVDHLLLANASMLNKMSPFFALLFSFLLLREKLTPVQVGVVAVAFGGSMLIVKPTLSNLDLVPSLLGLLGGICAGFAYTMVRKLGLKGERGSYIVFFFSTFSCLVLLPWLVLNYVPMTGYQLAMLLLAGVSATIGQFGITAAYTHAPAREVSVFDYSQVVFSAVLGYFVFRDVPDGWSFLGYLLIIGAAVVIFLYNNGYLQRRKENQG